MNAIIEETSAEEPIEPSDLDHLDTVEDFEPKDEEEFKGPDFTPMIPKVEEEKIWSGGAKNISFPEEAKEDQPEHYHQVRHCLAWQQIQELEGTEVVEDNGNAMISWKVIISYDLDDFNKDNFKGANINGIKKLIYNKANKIVNFWSGTMHEQLAHLNTVLHKRTNPERERRGVRPVKDVLHTELLTLIALIIGSINQSVQGSKLWGSGTDPTLS